MNIRLSWQVGVGSLTAPKYGENEVLRCTNGVCVENPQFSHFWATSFWIEVAGKLQYTVFHGCQFGSSRQKKTLLAHNHPAFHQLHRLCPGESKKHQHAAWGLTAQNTFATADETAYPFEFAGDVASVFVSILLQAGVKQPPQSFEDIESQSGHVLQAIRAQTAAQPRASKLPPLVPEFKQFVTRPIGPTQPALEQLKLLSSNPFAASRMKGREGSDSLDSGISLEIGSESHLHPPKLDQNKTGLCGVYHDPMEFVQKAV